MLNRLTLQTLKRSKQYFSTTVDKRFSNLQSLLKEEKANLNQEFQQYNSELNESMSKQ